MVYNQEFADKAPIMASIGGSLVVGVEKAVEVAEKINSSLDSDVLDFFVELGNTEWNFDNTFMDLAIYDVQSIMLIAPIIYTALKVPRLVAKIFRKKEYRFFEEEVEKYEIEGHSELEGAVHVVAETFAEYKKIEDVRRVEINLEGALGIYGKDINAQENNSLYFTLRDMFDHIEFQKRRTFEDGGLFDKVYKALFTGGLAATATIMFVQGLQIIGVNLDESLIAGGVGSFSALASFLYQETPETIGADRVYKDLHKRLGIEY